MFIEYKKTTLTASNDQICSLLKLFLTLSITSLTPYDNQIICPMAQSIATFYIISKKGYGCKNIIKRLFKSTTETQIKIKKNGAFIAVLHFSHSRAFNNDHNSYPKMNMKRSLACLVVFFTSAKLYHFYCLKTLLNNTAFFVFTMNFNVVSFYIYLCVSVYFRTTPNTGKL
jgi:hypothetical protein